MRMANDGCVRSIFRARVEQRFQSACGTVQKQRCDG
jgi:hypothetical protein